MSKKLKVFEVCAGVGGLSKPFHESKNFEVVGFSEIDKYCIQVLRKHYPEIENYGDLNHVTERNLPDFNVLIGGTPCQSFSEAGKRTGLKGVSGLFYQFVKVLKHKKPRYFVWENVRGTLHSTQGWDFAYVQMELAKAGYSFRWELLSAKDYGVPQNRERIFIVGCLRGQGSRKVFCPTGSSREDDKGKKENPKSNKVSTHEGIPCVRRDNILKKREIANNIDANYWKGMDNHGQRTMIAYSKSHREKHIDHRIKINEHANTLSTGDGCVSQSSANFILEEDVRLRKFTPTECEAVMSWEKGWTEEGVDEKGNIKKMSDTQRYKMCGNGVCSKNVKPIRNLIVRNENRLRRAKKQK